MARKHIPIGSDVELDAEIVSKGGGGGTLPNPITDTVTISPSTDEAALVINSHPGSLQSTPVVQVYDELGVLAIDVDPQGILDTRHIAVQDPPNTGGGPGSPAVTLRPGRLFIGDDGTHPVIQVDDVSTNQQVLFVRSPGHGDLLEISPSVATDVGLQIIEHGTPSVNSIEVWDNAFNNLLFGISKGGGVIFPAADPHVAGAWWDNAGTLTRSAG